jgi:hypothetical protein
VDFAIHWKRALRLFGSHFFLADFLMWDSNPLENKNCWK